MLTMFYDDPLEDADWSSTTYTATGPLQGPINTSLYDDAVRSYRATNIRQTPADVPALRGPLPSQSMGVSNKSDLMGAVVAGLIVWVLTKGLK